MKDQTKSGPDISEINPEKVLAYGDNFIFRVDDQNRHYLLLEVEDSDSDLGSSAVRIPMDVWHAIHQCGVHLFPLVHSTDDHLRNMGAAAVQTRKHMRRVVRRLPEDVSGQLDGFDQLGSVDDADEVQVQRVIEMLGRRRAAERELLERAQRHVVIRTLSNVKLGVWDFE
jgi:hypothetical protein